jgi:hypothetical protein
MCTGCIFHIFLHPTQHPTSEQLVMINNCKYCKNIHPIYQPIGLGCIMLAVGSSAVTGS